MTPLQILLASAVLAAIPAVLWTRFFLRRHPVDRRLALWTTVAGMVAVAPIMGYQALFRENPALDAFAAIHRLDGPEWGIYLLVFLFIGVLEELAKHWAMRTVDFHKREWRSVSDGIEFAVLAALGFAFVENIIYFTGILKMSGYAALIAPFLFRSCFSMFAHTAFAALYGYHFAMAKFAPEVMVEEVAEGHRFAVTKHVYRALKFPLVNWFARVVWWALCLGAVAAVLWWLGTHTLLDASKTFTWRWIELAAGGGVVLALGHLGLVGERHLARLTMPDVFAEEQEVEGLFLAAIAHMIFNFALWLTWTWAVPGYLFALGWYVLWELRQRRNLLDFESVEEIRTRVQAFAAARGRLRE